METGTHESMDASAMEPAEIIAYSGTEARTLTKPNFVRMSALQDLWKFKKTG